MVEGKGVQWQLLFTLLQCLVAFLSIGVLLFAFVGQVFAVDGVSMMPTLRDGQPLLVQKAGYTPTAGDVVVLTKSSFREGDPIVKRVIAVGGQTVKMDYADNAVYVDGKALQEPYLLERMQAYPAQFIDYIQVPQGTIFVLGDNRNNSGDSRDPALGVVDHRYVVGRALFVD